jgi:hypothetical protein
LGKSDDIDEQKLRDKAIRQLERAANMAYKMMTNERIDARTRQAWFKRYTDATRALNQVLKDRQAKDWEARIKRIEKYRKVPIGQAEPEESDASSENESMTGTV